MLLLVLLRAFCLELESPKGVISIDWRIGSVLVQNLIYSIIVVGRDRTLKVEHFIFTPRL